jgi:hypothetical protein
MGGGSPALQVGIPASPTSPTLIVSSLDLVNIQNLGAPDSWSGEIQVGFDQSKLVKSLRPLLARITFNTDPASSANAKVITDCAADTFLASSLTPNGYVTLGNGLIMQWGRTNANPNGITVIPFPTAFKSQVFSVVLSGTSDTGSNAKDNWPSIFNHPSSTTLTTFRITSANDTPDLVSWWAIGK